MHNANHYAYFDTLFIIQNIEQKVGSTARSELHLFAYLGCLLSLYEGKPSSNWGYQFAVTSSGYPYSAAIDHALEQMQSLGWIRDESSLFFLTPKGEQELIHHFLSFKMYQIRKRFLDGACSSILSIPIGIIRSTIVKTEEINGAIELSQTRLLLSDSAQTTLYEQFGALSKTIGVKLDNLMIPAVVWLTYLSEIKREEME